MGDEKKRACDQPLSAAQRRVLETAAARPDGWINPAAKLVAVLIVTVVLLLPTDDAPLADRAAALGQWCQGFLHGFGVNAGGLELSTDAKEVLQDLAAISQVQDALEESEDGEGDYMEVMEYLRVAPLLLFTETRKSAEPVAAKPSLH